ncbi:MAG TPA: hypothetical protein VGX94_14185 [Terriglobia bacterium]|nr:hypothetical protein [Terriglobia bacterium]
MRNRLVLITVAIITLIPLSVFATPITGELAFTGNVTATLTSLNFTCATGQTCSSGQGSFTIDGTSSTGTFAGLGGQTGQIMDINNTTTPPGQTVSLSNFLTLPGGVSFTLTQLDLGTGGACPPAMGTTCTPTSPLLVSPSDPLGKTGTVFEDTATGSTAEFSVNADAFLSSASGQTTAYTGTFSATFDGMSTAQVLAKLSSAGSISTPFSATFTPVSTTSVPEPGTASLFVMAGLLVLAGFGFRRFSHC